MKLAISSTVPSLGIVAPVACVIRGVKVVAGSNELDADVEEVSEILSRGTDAILGRPEVRAFRDLLRSLGYPDQVPAGERLVESFAKKGFRRFNNIVDAYNLVAARHGAGIGMHDAANVSGELHVRLSTGVEHIVPMFKASEVAIPAGDLIYGTERASPVARSFDTFAWLGRRDVDSDRHRVSATSTSLVLVVLGNSVTSDSQNRGICDEILHLIRKSCPLATMETLEREFLTD